MAVATEQTQLDKFKDAARDLECDDDKKRFEDRLKKLTEPRPGRQKP